MFEGEGGAHKRDKNNERGRKSNDHETERFFEIEEGKGAKNKESDGFRGKGQKKRQAITSEQSRYPKKEEQKRRSDDRSDV